MPTIYDSIAAKLEIGLNKTLATAKRADFCIGYFNLRGWDLLADSVERLEGANLDDRFDDDALYRCRALIGMQTTPLAELEHYFSDTKKVLITKPLKC
jgi:hypothetical protein